MREKKWIEMRGIENVDEIDVANFRKRNYMHFRDETLSAKVRKEEKQKALDQNGSLSEPLRYFVRELLSSDNEYTIKLMMDEFEVMHREDFLTLADIVKGQVGVNENITEETLSTMPKQDSFLLSQAIKWLDRREVRQFLGLEAVVSTKLTGYEKEIFVLKCYANYTQPGIIIRVGVRLLGQGFSFQERDILPLDELF